ncbi:hypothetical protein [Paraburkholderia sp. SUR17]|uniref:DUF6881 domain-containing protein n=1 Tax=Paraburkholderia sp. SUR17 TaxID=3034358 RepID=UPI002407C75F|nr:hypothetical protein [Paraburkholderia sp. SUR17]WEY37759.1 hypothetical protein P2869_11795 [Paraburkholderia sp. SUR17]
MADGLIALDVAWRHDFDAEPVRLVSVLDRDRYEIRKIEFFRDGRIGFADKTKSAFGTQPGLLPVPTLAEVNADPEFEAREITMKAFEALWSSRVP